MKWASPLCACLVACGESTASTPDSGGGTGQVEVTNEVEILTADLVEVIDPGRGWRAWDGPSLRLEGGESGTVALPPGSPWVLVFRSGDTCGFTEQFAIEEGYVSTAVLNSFEAVWDGSGCELRD